MKFTDAYQNALTVLSRKPLVLWGLSLLSGLITFLAVIFTLPILALGTIVSYLITVGMAKVYIDGLLGQEVNSDQIFAAFNGKFLRVAGGMAWQSLWILIWALVPIAGPVIACVKAYSYRFVPYILITRPDVSATQALRLSMQMTEGRKGQMFLADLCFLGGIFVVSFILGLFAAIPFIGLIFGLISFLFTIAVWLFSSIFQGLYGAAFYLDAAATTAE